MATLVRLSSQDRKELDKYTKFLTIKTVQVIVQSRLGEKFKTKSKRYSSGADWFSVTIDDVPEVLAETKKALGSQLPTIGVTLCVEISLKTAEGETMVLETWCLGVLDHHDTDTRVNYSIYNRMGILLKSLIAVTRVTPAYRLSCRQGPDSYVICYRVHLGEPDLSILGEGYQHARVGQVGTPVGTFFLSVGFRTKLTITPQPVEKDSSIMVKSDHFKPDLSPKRPHRLPPHMEFKEFVTDELAAAACDECHEPNHAPTAIINEVRECNGVCPHQHIGATLYDKSPRSEKDIDFRITNAGDRQMSFSEYKKIGAFAGEPKKLDSTVTSEDIVPETAFMSLLRHDTDNNIIQNKNIAHSKKLPNVNNCNNNVATNSDPDHSDMDTCSETGSHESQKSTTSIASAVTDDFVMVELKTPFASPDPNNDLSTFYRECQSAPQLNSFRNNPTLAEQVNDLTNQLATFEMNMQDFDDLVDSLCSSETWK